MSATYRHRVTGLIGSYPEPMAAVYADVLELVADDAKPRAYAPIDPAVIAKRVTDTPQTPEAAPADSTPTPEAQKGRGRH